MEWLSAVTGQLQRVYVHWHVYTQADSRRTCGGEAAQHKVWLLNWTTTKAVEGMTAFEVAFGKKPNLKGVHEWGEKVLEYILAVLTAI